MTKTTLAVEGMQCMHCVQAIEKALKDLAGTKDVSVSLERKQVTVSHSEDLEQERLVKAVQEAGYEVSRS